MTQAPLAPYAGIGDPVGPVAQPLPIGSLVYLASYLIRMKLNAETTGPDTPNLYSADLKILGDQGDMNLDPLVGPRGLAGQHHFPLREQEVPIVNVQADLPTNMTNTPNDIGKYWLVDELDTYGNVIGEFAWIWWGTTWRKLMMGSYGVPGPVPEIQPIVELIEPQPLPTYPDTTSFMDTSGTTLEPTWVFNLAVPAGIPGAVTDMYDFPDWDTTNAPTSGQLVGATGRYTAGGDMIWAPTSVSQYMPGPWSLPEGSFSAYTGVAQRAAIGSFAVPPQPWPWTPIVWGHLGGSTVSTVASSNAQQLINVTALGGTFTLNVLGVSTPPIPYDASHTTILGFVENLISVGVGNVAATLQGSMNTLLEFVNDLSAQVISPIVADVTNLIPPDLSAVAISVLDSGGNMINNVVNMLTGDPLMIGCEVLLGDPVNGQMISRGLGNILGRIAIMPHYSRSDLSGHTSDVITPTNRRAIVPANHASPAQGTVYVNLWNDGALGIYDFNPQNAQLFLMVLPMLQQPGATPAGTRRRGRRFVYSERVR